MGFDGDFDPAVVEFPGISYSPGYESGFTWATQYSSEVSGALALSQGLYYVSNFLTRDIAGRTAGICVNPWDFNYVKARTVDGIVVGRPPNYNRTSFQSCDCSYHKCDREFEGMGYTLDFAALWSGDTQTKGLREVFSRTDGVDQPIQEVPFPSVINSYFNSLGFPQAKRVTSSYLLTYGFFNGDDNRVVGFINKEKFNEYKQALLAIDGSVFGNKESALLTYAIIDFALSVTGGVFFKNNIVSALAFAQDTLELSEDADWENAASDIIYNYQKNANIPGFEAEFVYSSAGLDENENIQEKCMCLDAGLHGFDAYPFADVQIVNDQLTVEEGIGGQQAFDLLGFTGNQKDLASFLTIDGRRLKALGVTGAKEYRYGPNWTEGYGFSDLNVISVSTPEYKNWEVRDSGKIRMSGTPNGEPYSFGPQWLEWGQRIGVPSIETVPINPITIGGGNFGDANFGYKGKVEGSLIYRGRLKGEVLPYEGQDYKFVFSGITLKPGVGNNNKVLLGLNTIRHIDAVTNYDAYGITGSIEDIVFSEGFSESPHDKTIYRL